MKYTISIIATLFLLVGTAHAAIYMEYEGVKGEVTNETQSDYIYQHNETELEFVNTKTLNEGEWVEDDTPGQETHEWEEQETDGAKGGNVEYEWKVEEGESLKSHDSDNVDSAGKSDDDANEPDRWGDDAKRTEVFSELSEDDELFLDIENMIDDLEEDISETDESGSEDDNDDRGKENRSITVDGTELRNFDSEKKKEILELAPNTPRDVDDDTDFAFLVMRTAHDDAAMESVSFNFEKIDISYQSGGKLFGLIPIVFTEDIELDTDGDDTGRVKVKLPWFSFLVNEDVIGSEIEEEASKEGNKEWIEIQSWQFARAEAFDVLSNILKTKHDTAKNNINNMR